MVANKPINNLVFFYLKQVDLLIHSDLKMNHLIDEAECRLRDLTRVESFYYH